MTETMDMVYGPGGAGNGFGGERAGIRHRYREYPRGGTITALAEVEMPEPERRSAIETKAEVVFQERTWVAERIGWTAIAVIVAAALLGLFGRGPFSSATASTDDERLAVSYQRFWRFQSPTQLQFAVSPADDVIEARLWLGRDYLDAMSLMGVTPQPERVEASADRFTYVFALSHPGESFGVTFRIEPERAWQVRGSFGLEGGESLSIRQFIFP